MQIFKTKNAYPFSTVGLDELICPPSRQAVEETGELGGSRIQRVPVPYTLHPEPYTLHPEPYTLHPTPYTLHPTPYTLHPTPYTLHPTPYTPHPSPHTRRMWGVGNRRM